MKLTIEQKKAFQVENSFKNSVVFMPNFLYGMTDFCVLIQEKIAKLDLEESKIYFENSSKRKAYYYKKLHNLANNVKHSILNYVQYPKKNKDLEPEMITRKKDARHRLITVQMDFFILINYKKEILHEMGLEPEYIAMLLDNYVD